MEIKFATKGIIFKEGKVLLITKSDEEDVNPNTVDIPGGRLEFGEMPVESLQREIMEETSLKVEVGRPTRCWSFVKKEKGFQLVGVTFYCRFIEGVEKLSHEHDSFIWVDPDEIISGEYPGWLKEEIKAALEVDNESKS